MISLKRWTVLFVSFLQKNLYATDIIMSFHNRVRIINFLCSHIFSFVRKAFHKHLIFIATDAKLSSKRQQNVEYTLYM